MVRVPCIGASDPGFQGSSILSESFQLLEFVAHLLAHLGHTGLTVSMTVAEDRVVTGVLIQLTCRNVKPRETINRKRCHAAGAGRVGFVSHETNSQLLFLSPFLLKLQETWATQPATCTSDCVCGTQAVVASKRMLTEEVPSAA